MKAEQHYLLMIQNPPQPPVTFIDSHTGGEPTRVIVEGGPDLGTGSIAERREILQREYNSWMTSVINEPRGSDVLVGALLCPPVDPTCAAGVIYFDNVGVIQMCGHGTIGVTNTLAHLGRIGVGKFRLETSVGEIAVEYHGDNRASLENVHSFRHAKDIAIDVVGHGTVAGDIAWGGNWFFLVEDHGQALKLDNVDHLTNYTWRIRQALERNGVSGANGQLIDHIILYGPPDDPKNNSRDFVLCPGRAYDRSPCGTGTSAKMACLFADGKLEPGEVWRQESILGGVFEGSVRLDGERIIPRITGSAYIMAEGKLLFDANDPFVEGIRR